MTDNSIISTLKPEDSFIIHPIKQYIHSIETKIVSNIDNHALSSEKRLSKIEKVLSDLSNDFLDIQIKLNDNKIKCLKIDELCHSNQKVKDQISSHDNKINKQTKDVYDALNKFNQILNDHLTIPGLVGNYCKFKSIREYINYNNQQINNLIISKNKVMNETEKFQKKIQEALGKFTHKHSSYGNSSCSELKNSFDESVKEANEKFYSMIIENRKDVNSNNNNNHHHHNENQQLELLNSNSIDEEGVEAKNNNAQNTQWSYSSSNNNNNHHQRDNIIKEIRDMKKDINLLKEQYCSVIRKESSKDNFKSKKYKNLEMLKTKSPSTPQYKLKKKKKQGTKGFQSFTQHCLNTTDIPLSGSLKDWKKDENGFNEIDERKTFLTENINVSYNKIAETKTNFNKDIQENTCHLFPINSNSNDIANKKSKDKKMNNSNSGTIINKKSNEPIIKETKTKEIPYNRSIRNRIQTQMFCGREKISLLNFVSKKDRTNLCLPLKKDLNLSKVKSVDHLKAGMNDYRSKKNNQLAISSDSKVARNPNTISLHSNDKLQIECSLPKTNEDNNDHDHKQGHTILECCFEDRKE